MSLIEDAVPGVAEAKAVIGVAKILWPVIAALGGLGAVAGFALYIHELQAGKARAEAQAAQQHAVAVVQTGQAAAAGQAAQIVSQGAQQHDLTIHVQQENDRAILAAPGAAQAVDPRLNDIGRRGLCRYAAYAGDPECAGLRQPDPGGGPAAGQGRAAAAG